MKSGNLKTGYNPERMIKRLAKKEWPYNRHYEQMVFLGEIT